MKQKIKLTIPEGDSMWPKKFQGKAVEVEIEAVKFPDGLFWGTTGDGYLAAIDLVDEQNAASPPVFSEPHPTIERLFGDRIQSLHVDFWEKKEPKK